MIKIRNDGKEKSESWEAEFAFERTFPGRPNAFSVVDLSATGPTEHQAIAGLRLLAEDVIMEIGKVDYGDRCLVDYSSGDD